jgi:hypothetical protein
LTRLLPLTLDAIPEPYRSELPEELLTIANTTDPSDAFKEPPSRRRQKERARVHRDQVHRACEEFFTLTRIQQHGFTHPHNGFFVMLPQEFDVVLAFEPKPVAQVILEVLRQTIGKPGDGPQRRGVWAVLSYSHFAQACNMARSTAQRGVERAVKQGYLLRGKHGQRTIAYAIKWRSAN